MCLNYESLRLPETSIFKWSGYNTLANALTNTLAKTTKIDTKSSTVKE